MNKYGTITITGWLSNDSRDEDDTWFDICMDEEGQQCVAAYDDYAVDNVVVEYKDAPVIFKDGDVVRWKVFGEIGGRYNGEWLLIHKGEKLTNLYSDSYVRDCLDNGSAVLLVAAL